MFSEKNVLNSQKVLQPLKISEPAREQYSKHGEIEVFKRLSPQGTYCCPETEQPGSSYLLPLQLWYPPSAQCPA